MFPQARFPMTTKGKLLVVALCGSSSIAHMEKYLR